MPVERIPEYHFRLERESRFERNAHTDLWKRLSDAGFESDDLEKLDFDSLDWMQFERRLSLSSDVSDETLKFIVQSTQDSSERVFMLERIASGFGRDGWLDNLNRMLAPGRGQSKKMSDARVIIRENIDLFLNHKENVIAKCSRFNRHINGSLKIVVSDLYRLFDFEVENVIKTVDDLVASNQFLDIDEATETLQDFIKTNRFARTTLAGCKGSNFKKLLSKEFPDIITSERSAELVNKLLRSDDNWSSKTKIFLEFMSGERIPVISQDLFNENLILSWAQDYIKSNGSKEGITIDKLTEAAESLPPEKKFEFISMLYKGLSAKQINTVKEKAIRSVAKNGVPDLLTLAGIEKKTIERIKRRENPFHPLNTLNIARTVGYEIEYRPGQIDGKIRSRGGFELLDFLGFKSGDGGGGDCETSPGPFWDPITAVTVFNLYSDADIIQRTRHSQTFHFNVGILPPPPEFITLIRALHASGYAKNPNIRFDRPELHIWDKYDHTEGKAFDVVSKKGFAWTMESASFLSWAMAAHIKTNNHASGLNEWDRKLASIWNNYISVVNKGLESVSFGNYLFNDDNRDISVENVIDQLKLIFPDPNNTDPSCFYKDVSKIDKSTSSYIRPINFGGVAYSNISHFIRVITDKHVSQIGVLVDEVENAAKMAILKIDQLSGGARKTAIRSFIREYKTPVGNETDEAYEKAYLKVRSIFVQK